MKLLIGYHQVLQQICVLQTEIWQQHVSIFKVKETLSLYSVAIYYDFLFDWFIILAVVLNTVAHAALMNHAQFGRIILIAVLRHKDVCA